MNTGSDFLDLLSASSASNRAVAVYSHVVRATGDETAALLLSQICYWTRKGTDVEERDGWIYKTAVQWHLELGLTKKMQLRARSLLRELALIEENVSAAAGGRVDYRLNLHALANRVVERIHVQMSERIRGIDLHAFRTDDALFRALLGRSITYHRAAVDITGSVRAALYLSYLVYMYRDQKVDWHSGWVTVDASRAALATGLGRREQDTARAALLKQQFLLQRLEGYPCRLQIRLAESALRQRLLAFSAVSRRVVAPVDPIDVGDGVKAAPVPDRTVDRWHVGRNFRPTETAAEVQAIDFLAAMLERHQGGVCPKRQTEALLRLDVSALGCRDQDAFSPGNKGGVPETPSKEPEGCQNAKLGDWKGVPKRQPEMAAGCQNAKLGVPETPSCLTTKKGLQGKDRTENHHPQTPASGFDAARSVVVDLRPDEKAGPNSESPGTSQRRVDLDPSELDWPKLIADPDRDAALHWLREIPVEAQTVLDEVRYQHGIKPVVNPVAYVRKLVQQVKALTFVPEGAAGMAAKRAEAKVRLEAWRREEAARLARLNAAPDQAEREADSAAARRFFDAWRELRKPRAEQAGAITRSADGGGNAQQTSPDRG